MLSVGKWESKLTATDTAESPAIHGPSTQRTDPRRARVRPGSDKRVMPTLVPLTYSEADMVAAGVFPVGERSPRRIASSVSRLVVMGSPTDANTARAAYR